MGFQSANVDTGLMFAIADGAAAPSTAVALIAAGLPDATDVAEVVMPAAGLIQGISCQSAPASGDTVILAPTIGGTRQTSLTATATNAAPAASAWSNAGIAFAAGQTVGIKYLTTTGGTYGVHDILGILYVAFTEQVGGQVI